MNLWTVFIYILALTLFLSFGGGSTDSYLPADKFLGISPEDVIYYKSSDFIKCKDGSKKFTKSQLNDDFCDCPDGTDEPGTSACPVAKFYCQNAGHVSTLLFSSRVNDGICDCCDGSDEYDGKVQCKNTCWEAGKVARNKLKRKIATYQEGVAIRKRELEQARDALIKDEEELVMLKNEEKTLKELVQRLRERKEQIEKVEEKERLQKEHEEKARKEAEDIANGDRQKIEDELKFEKSREIEQESETEVTENMSNEEIGLVEDSPLDQEQAEESGDLQIEVEYDQTASDGKTNDGGATQRIVGANDEHTAPVSRDEPGDSSESIHKAGDAIVPDQVIAGRDDGPENNEGLSKEELGRLVASRWTGEKIEKEGEADSGEDSIPEAYELEDLPEDSHYEDDGGYASETYDEDKKNEYDDADTDIDEHFGLEDQNDKNIPYHSESDEESDSEFGSSFSWLEKIQRTVRNVLQAVNIFRSPLDKSEAAQVRKEYDKLSAKLSKMQSRISSLSKKLKQDFGPEKEFYSFYGHCFELKQNKYVYKVCPFKQATQEEGYSKTRLGRWDKFDDSYKTMIFADGDNCWNGPDRSMKVKLRCGLKNELADVDEPSRCEYEALLSTPALCSEARLKELQHKLDQMNHQKPNSHDEL